KARLDSERFARLAVSDSPDLSNPLISDPDKASEANDFVVTLSVSGLKADTKYYYAIGETDGTLNQPFGSFQTFPAPGCQVPYDFTIAVGSDASVGSNALVFEAIEGQDPDLLFHLGGLHYGDIGTDDVSEYRAAYRTVLTRPRQASLFRNVSSVYVWDDHDFGANDSDSTYVGRASAKAAYLEYVPHHSLASDSEAAGVYRSFTLGRVRVIVTDARFHRSPKEDADGPTKTMLGPTQKAWLKAELLAARDRYPLILWINPVPWIESVTAGSDRWGGFATERAELAQFIAENDLYDRLVMLSSDAHMIAADDGSYSGYASGDVRGGFPVIHAAAFDRSGSYKGGPYRLGARAGTMQYGLLTLTDECADRVDVEFKALGSLDQTIVSDADYNVDDPITFRQSFLAGGDHLVRKGASWRYTDDGKLPSADWASPNYIDTGWKSGRAQLGYGDVPAGKTEIDVATEIEFGFQPLFKNITYYFRTFFEISNKEDIKSLVANILVDDGAVVYLNGFEVLRRNMPAGIIEPETLAESAIEGADEATFFPADLSAAVGSLFNGTNVLAVEVHQVAASSPDVSLDVELFAVTSEIAANIKPIADVSASPLTGDAPLEVTFDGSDSVDPDGSIETYSWNFGDGVTSAQPTLAHTYSAVGAFEA
ncbi:MAG: alkaline phosphatase D family protein, partial [Rhodothermia bacterium]